MLIRVSGGNGGVAEYLRMGRKAGRKATRNELDRRVVLQGNLSATDRLIRSMKFKGERFLHFTLGFKEDAMLPELLRKISERFRSFLMAAFDDDEYCYYAEAHLPRIKSYINQVDGEYVQRKPHIHVVVPCVNLISGQRLDPLGRVRHTERYYDAFQEAINCEFGLVSPKQSHSVSLAGGSVTISRLTGDVFVGSTSRQLKSRVLQLVMDEGVTEWSAFLNLVARIGPTRVRNASKPTPYAHVIPVGAAHGVNLREYVFSPEFIALPLAAKQMRLGAKPDGGYVEKAKGRPLLPEYESTLRAWQRRRAHEVRWLNSGHKKLWQEYQEAADPRKMAILAERKERWVRLHRKSGPVAHLQSGVESQPERVATASVMPVFASLVGGRMLAAVGTSAPDAVDPTLQPTARAAPWGDSRIGQLAYDHAQRLMEEHESQQPTIEHAKRHLDGERLLATLVQSHGALSHKYRAFLDDKGIPRIQCGNRRLNIADFLTKEMHLAWEQARDLMLTAYEAQVHHDVADSPTGSPSAVDSSQELGAHVIVESEQTGQEGGRPVDSSIGASVDTERAIEDPSGTSIETTLIDVSWLAEVSNVPSDTQPAHLNGPAPVSLAEMASTSGEIFGPATAGGVESATPPTPAITTVIVAPSDAAISGEGPLDSDDAGRAKRRFWFRRGQPTPEIGSHHTLTVPEALPPEPHAQDTSPLDRAPIARISAMATPALATVERRACAYDEQGNPTVFVDSQSVSSDHWEDDSVLRTMIEVAHDFGSELSVEGTIEFKEAVGRMAAELGIEILFSDPLAADSYEARRTELAASNAPGM